MFRHPVTMSTGLRFAQPVEADMPRILPLVGTSSFSHSTSIVSTPTWRGCSGSVLMSKMSRLFVLVAKR